MHKIKYFSQLLKFRLSATVVFSAIMGYLLASNEAFFSELCYLTIGGFLVTGCANALNQIWERKYDKLMKRTCDRPLPKRHLNVTESLIFAFLIGIIGLIVLYQLNKYCTYYGFLSIVFYVLFYTPLKRISPLSIFIGAIPGAIPFLLGWVAAFDFTLVSSDEATGFGIAGGVLFAIQFFWQFPHFISIAWVQDDEYKKAGFKMMIGGQKGKQAAMAAIICSILMIICSAMPYYVEGLIMSKLSVIIILILGFWFTHKSILLYKNLDDHSAKRLMLSSFIYLPLSQIILVLTKYNIF
jgi:protoheme IX farnesyltransferase